MRSRSRVLSDFINNIYLSRRDAVSQLFFPRHILRKNASYVSAGYLDQGISPKRVSQSVAISAYEHEHPLIQGIIAGIRPLTVDLHAAIVHGSYGYGDPVGYSDFDGLLIVKDETVRDPERLAGLAAGLRRLRKEIFKIDPLQHHGWFVLAERDLEHYPGSFLPPETLMYARSLTGKAQTLNITMDEPPDYRAHLNKAAANLLRSLRIKPEDMNLYRLKGVFSLFMLMPALYVQARDGKGIFKKFSFDEARRDFTAEEFGIMDEISSIRHDWKVRLTSFQRFALSGNGIISSRFRKVMHLPPPPELRPKLTTGLFSRMEHFTKLCISKSQ